ncbi:immune-associated nucleotide-binding protein 9-like [Lolium rigidum]|uniref:immune-associated nucleotide-binding protein 9-like n=1 Tax=Lolium rigidum TaxID=89674 RepID=UPI001F5DBA73|nr:immune-associated nucleotide-binding protein 9-like [Lolium rigidum]
MGGGRRRRRRPGGVATPCPSHGDVTLALVGKVGSGKSATANSILGEEAFASKRSYRGVTRTCQNRSKAFQEGSASRTLNVIDTPGFFDMESTAEDIRKEIAKCMDKAKDGIHAILLVFSAASRLSCEDENTIESIKLFFGDKILDHAILVFTHGDEVGGMIGWKEMLSDSATPYLQEMLKLFENRVVLFDNKTSDAELRQSQINSLFDALDFVLSINDEMPFSNEMFMNIQEAHQMFKSKREIYDEYLMHITKMVDEKLNCTIERLEKELQEEQKARQYAVNIMADRIRSLQQSLEKAENDRKVAMERLKKAEDDTTVVRKENEKLKNERCIIL